MHWKPCVMAFVFEGGNLNLLNSLMLITGAVAIDTKVDEDNVHWWQSRIYLAKTKHPSYMVWKEETTSCSCSMIHSVIPVNWTLHFHMNPHMMANKIWEWP